MQIQNGVNFHLKISIKWDSNLKKKDVTTILVMF